MLLTRATEREEEEPSMAKTPFTCRNCGMAIDGLEAEYVVDPDLPLTPVRRHFFHCPPLPPGLQEQILPNVITVEEYDAMPPRPKPPIRCTWGE